MSCDAPSDQLHDQVLLEEIELLTNVIIAGNHSSGRLTAEQVDEVLGVTKLTDGRLPAQRGLASAAADR